MSIRFRSLPLVVSHTNSAGPFVTLCSASSCMLELFHKNKNSFNQGSHKNLKTEFHDFSMTDLLLSMDSHSHVVSDMVMIVSHNCHNMHDNHKLEKLPQP